MEQKALVTGASCGIGAAIAMKLAGNGYNLVLTGRDTAQLDKVKTRCEQHRVSVDTQAADLSNESEISGLFAKAGAIGLLANNVGFGVFHAIKDIKPDDWRAIQTVNVEGAFLCMREAMKSMKAAGGGRWMPTASRSPTTAPSWSISNRRNDSEQPLASGVCARKALGQAPSRRCPPWTA